MVTYVKVISIKSVKFTVKFVPTPTYVSEPGKVAKK